MNFGYDGNSIYLHSAQYGRKIDILRKNIIVNDDISSSGTNHLNISLESVNQPKRDEGQEVPIFMVTHDQGMFSNGEVFINFINYTKKYITIV
ncbi:MAG: hypothetical protein Q8N08_00850 [Methanobacteriaceae archaeon]|nr:hypothetical protein [Methanobacteriaceae archaeon]